MVDLTKEEMLKEEYRNRFKTDRQIIVKMNATQPKAAARNAFEDIQQNYNQFTSSLNSEDAGFASLFTGKVSELKNKGK